MPAKLRGIQVSLLLQATATIGVATVMAILLKVAGAKIVAIALGPSGMGLYAQLVLITEIGAALFSMGLTAGIVRFASEFRSAADWPKLRALESTLIFTIIPLSLLAAAAVAIFSGELSRALLGESSFGVAVALAGLCFPLMAATGVAMNLVRQARLFRLAAVFGLATTAAELALLVPLVLLLGVLGAGIALLVSRAIRAAVAWFIAIRLETGQPGTFRFSPAHFNPALLNGLFKYASTTMICGALAYLSALVVRTFIVTDLGPAANGVYQVVWAAQAAWLSIALSSFYPFQLPAYCELNDLAHRRAHVNRLVRLLTLAATPCLCALMIFRSEVVLAAYTPQFLPAAPLLGLSLLYGLFSLLDGCLNLPLLATGKLRATLVLALLQQGLFVAASYALLPVFQLHGVVYAGAISTILGAAARLLYARAALGISLSRANVRAFGLSVMLIVAVFGLSYWPRPLGVPASLVLTFAWAKIVMERSEAAALANTARLALQRRG